MKISKIIGYGLAGILVLGLIGSHLPEKAKTLQNHKHQTEWCDSEELNAEDRAWLPGSDIFVIERINCHPYSSVDLEGMTKTVIKGKQVVLSSSGKSDHVIIKGEYQTVKGDMDSGEYRVVQLAKGVRLPNGKIDYIIIQSRIISKNIFTNEWDDSKGMVMRNERFGYKLLKTNEFLSTYEFNHNVKFNV